MKTLLLAAAIAHSYDFAGTITVNNCSGSLVRFENSTADARAMMLTSGRCVEGDFIAPNGYRQNSPADLSMDLKNSKGETVSTLKSTKLLYAATSPTNVALYELTKTYQEIEAQTGITPFTLSSQKVEKDSPIDLLSAKKNWGMSCEVNSFPAELVEWNWVLFDSIYYSTYPVPGCKTKEGMQGSPVVRQGTREIIAVDSTRNLATDLRCRLGNPCEINYEGGYIIYGMHMSYGQETSLIYQCLDANQQIDLTLDDCMLPPNRYAPTPNYNY